MLDQLLFRLKHELRATIEKAQDSKQLFTHQSGRRLLLSEVIEQGTMDGPVIGAIAIFYSKGKFMTVDRILNTENNKYKKLRRIIYYLDSRAGQIGSTLLLELLKINDGEKFSKAEFVQHIDKEFFKEFAISSGEINEALSRMFRKTMKPFFGVRGRFFERNNFTIYFKEMVPRKDLVFQKDSYERSKQVIDSEINSFIKNLNKTV